MKLSLFLLSTVSANCPSDQCWTYDATTDTCTVKSGAECGYSLTCGGDSMSFDFPEELFGTDNPVNFVEHDGCHPTVQTDGTLDWTNPLGTCGTQMTQIGNKIIVTKTLCIDPDVVDVDGYQLQLEGSKSGSAVKLTCEYEMSATVSTDTQLVTSGSPSISDTGYGTFNEHLSLDFYEDCSFTTKDTTGLQVVGEKVCVGVTWNGNPIGDAMGFYIENCRVANSAEVTGPVTSLSDISGVEIVKNTCYANLLNAQLENDPTTQKWDTEQVGMSYTSFVYGSNKEQSQSVWCEVKFCLKDSCPTDIPYDDASCPEDAILGYTAM